MKYIKETSMSNSNLARRSFTWNINKLEFKIFYSISNEHKGAILGTLLNDLKCEYMILCRVLKSLYLNTVSVTSVAF